MDQPVDGLLILSSPLHVEGLPAGVGGFMRDKHCDDAAATSNTGWYCLQEKPEKIKSLDFQ